MFFLRRPRLEVTERCVHGSPKRCLNSLSFKRQSQLVTRSCRHKVNSSPVNSSHTCLVTQSTRHKRAHNKSASRNFFYLHSGQVAPRNSAEHGRRHYGNNAGWIKMALGMEVGFGPGHIVLDVLPVLFPKKGAEPHFRPIFIVTKRLDVSRCHLVWR